ncbi:MAG: DUF4296 domain-containing protein [Bacteroidales bacterium]|nr:DUF4296 domain-containing protein [Bacteroidales bacterium]MBR1799822.1 DUF4296 domain-containing protein [Bacteroidales bacterium]
MTMPKSVAHRIFTLALLCACCISVACHRNRLPDGILDHHDMVNFLTQAYQLEGFYAVETNFTFDSINDEIISAYDRLLESQHLSREEVERSLFYYSEHPDKYFEIHKEVVRILDSISPKEIGTGQIKID